MRPGLDDAEARTRRSSRSTPLSGAGDRGADPRPARRRRAAARGARADHRDGRGQPAVRRQTLRMLVDDGALRPRDGRWAATGDVALAIPPTIQRAARPRAWSGSTRASARWSSAQPSSATRSGGAPSPSSRPGEVRRGSTRPCSRSRARSSIGPDRSEIGGEDAFRFTPHPRSATRPTAASRRAARAELHERFAGWIEVKARDSAGEYEEIVGYHLEQAHARGWSSGRSTTTAGRSAGARPRLAPPGARVRPRGHAGRRQPALAGDALCPRATPSAPELLAEVASRSWRPATSIAPLAVAGR